MSKLFQTNRIWIRYTHIFNKYCIFPTIELQDIIRQWSVLCLLTMCTTDAGTRIRFPYFLNFWENCQLSPCVAYPTGQNYSIELIINRTKFSLSKLTTGVSCLITKLHNEKHVLSGCPSGVRTSHFLITSLTSMTELYSTWQYMTEKVLGWIAKHLAREYQEKTTTSRICIPCNLSSCRVTMLLAICLCL